MITITAKILDIEHKIDVFIVNNKNFNYELLIGLDCIKKFKLTQNEDLKIEQRIPDFAERYENGENLENKREIPGKTRENNQNSRYSDEEISESQRIGTKLVNFNEHVAEEKFRISINCINYYEKTMIENLVEKYKSLFARDKYDVGIVKDYEARIDLIVDKYCNKRPYRFSIEDKLEIEKQFRNY